MSVKVIKISDCTECPFVRFELRKGDLKTMANCYGPGLKEPRVVGTVAELCRDLSIPEWCPLEALDGKD